MPPTPPTVLSTSTQNIYIQITSVLPSGAPYDPTAFPVGVCILPLGDEPLVFTPAAWQTSFPAPTVQYLVGPANGGQALQPGLYDVYVMITTSSEVPVIYSGQLRVILSGAT